MQYKVKYTVFFDSRLFTAGETVELSEETAKNLGAEYLEGFENSIDSASNKQQTKAKKK